jgi:hypothetical protein
LIYPPELEVKDSVPPKETNMLSMRNSSILITCSSE